MSNFTFPVASGSAGASVFTPVLTRSAYIDGGSYGEIANASAPNLVLTGSFTVEAGVHFGRGESNRFGLE